MHTKLARFFTITVLALVLGSVTVAPVAAQSTGRQLDGGSQPVTVVSSTQTTTVDRTAHTVTVTTTTYYSDGTWERVVDTWSYTD
ncbi:MAG: hypothetical protein QOJ70_1103 [Acidobacteriota bacterium]|jgi:hypothetical protein|nr:hypothetical protein [Acidobacteriota bacterium]